MPVTLRQLGYFVALVEERHFGRAADRLRITQPALTMQIQDLEQTLGVRLVERRPRDLQLTRAGREALTRARRVLAEVGEMESAARRQSLASRLNLGIIPTVAPYLLPPVLMALRQSGRAGEIRIREARTETLLRGLDEGELDAIVIATPPAGQDVVEDELFEDRFLLAGSAARLEAVLADEGALRPRKIDPEDLLLLDEGHCLADQALEVCGLDRRRGRVDLGASSLSTLCRLVAQGFGLTFLPELAVKDEQTASPGIRVARFEQPEPFRIVRLVRRASSEDDGWFSDLASVLAAAGRDIAGRARAAREPAAPSTGSGLTGTPPQGPRDRWSSAL